MSLPIRTTVEDIERVCSYLATKPIGATLAEARAVVDNKHLGGRKLAALKFWGLLEDEGDRIKITEQGRQAVRNSNAYRSNVLQKVVHQIPPYAAIVEKVHFGGEATVTANEVAAHWYEHFNDSVSESEVTLNDQAICFFHIAQAADLGALIIGRRGQQTRFEFDAEVARTFIDVSIEDTQQGALPGKSVDVDELPEELEIDSNELKEDDQPIESIKATGSNRVFIAHGRNHNILEQVKEIVEFGKYEPVISMNQETTAKPVPQKVMDDMRSCEAAVILVSADNLGADENISTPQINSNVLIEIGAAMALYGDKFVLLVEDGVELPSNLQGLYECRYSGDELSWATTRKLLQAFNDFR